VAYPIQAINIEIPKIINGATIIFKPVAYQTVLDFIACLKLPSDNCIPMAIHANGVQSAAKIVRILAIGGNNKSIRNGENA